MLRTKASPRAIGILLLPLVALLAGCASSARGKPCRDSSECPRPYTCGGHGGLVVIESCQVPCDSDAECPPELVCLWTRTGSADLPQICMRSNELGYEVGPPEMRFTGDPMRAPEGAIALTLIHFGGPDGTTYMVHAYRDGLVAFEGLKNTLVVGTRWRMAPVEQVTTLEARLCRSGFDTPPLASDRAHPHAALAVERCARPIRISFETFATDAASVRAQHALDDVLDSLHVRPFAGLARHQ